MRLITFGMAAGEADAYRIAIENLGESWRADHAAAVQDAMEHILCGAQAVILGGEASSEALIRRLTDEPCTAPPYIVRTGAPCGLCDLAGCLSPAQMADRLTAFDQSARLPALCMLSLPGLTCLARSLIAALSVRTTLRANVFLSDMLALCAAHPPLMDDLSGRLYPLVARRHALRPQTVERSLRLLVESTWSGSRLDVLERFFGHSVDPERGKPTNKEFLAQLQLRLTLADARLRAG